MPRTPRRSGTSPSPLTTRETREVEDVRDDLRPTRDVAPALARPDEADENRIRPERLDDYVGQAGVKENLRVFVRAALERGEPLDHVLLSGPPGLGKSTLARIIAHELGTRIHTTSGPILERPADLAAILTSLEKNDVLFIDEIHRMRPVVEEILYPALEDFELDILIGQGPDARSVRIPVTPFTLVGATTRTGLLTSPLRARFGVTAHLDFYGIEELAAIVERASTIYGIPIERAGAREIAQRSRGTPRTANRLLRRVRDFAQVLNRQAIDAAVADQALARLGVDRLGLDALDRRYLDAVGVKFEGGPVGLATIAAALGETEDTIEEVVEPFLVQLGFIDRTPRGRTLTRRAAGHLGLALASPEPLAQPELFDGRNR